MMDSTIDALKSAIEEAIPEARAQVDPGAGAGHFCLTVRAPVFAQQSMVQSHRLVLSAVAHLMRGQQAPVHAIDELKAIPA